jgi:hypothetical protein
MNTTLKRALYLDDVRTPTVTLEGFAPFAVVRNYDQFVGHIQSHGVPDLISFDHDLADEHMMDYFTHQANGIAVVEYDKFTEKTGLDCIKWLCNYILDEHEKGNTIPMPAVRVHSHNPVGGANIHNYANNFCASMGWPAAASFLRVPFEIATQVDE